MNNTTDTRRERTFCNLCSYDKVLTTIIYKSVTKRLRTELYSAIFLLIKEPSINLLEKSVICETCSNKHTII